MAEQNKDILQIVSSVDVHVLSLIARRDKARQYSMNIAMSVEADLCDAQIDVLREHRAALMIIAEQ